MGANFLKDRRFLEQLDNAAIKESYVRITVLSWNEEPIEEIQGIVLSGNLNLAGKSTMRRTANLSVLTDEEVNDLTKINALFSINRKIRLEQGLLNTVPNYIYESVDKNSDLIVHNVLNYQEAYGDIVWFPLGTYVIFDPSISHGSDGIKISMNLKDKMCLLNGDAGGVIPAAVHFHQKEQDLADGSTIITYPTLRQIIQECVNHFGEEALENIIIEDLDERVKQVMQYIGSSPLYFVDTVSGPAYFFNYDEAVAAAGGLNDAVRTFTNGSDIGYCYTDFTYPGQLISDIGSTVTSILDKIVAVLGNFEYFYDVYGKFHFQEIKNYLNKSYTSSVLSNISAEEDYKVELAGSKSVYTFAGTRLVNTFNNAPKYSNIKNDFVVWGVRKTTDGLETPIRYHLAIDEKPVRTVINNVDCYGLHYAEFYEDDLGNTKAKIVEGGRPIYTQDWREELYYQGLEAVDTGTDTNYYFTELVNEWPKLYNLEAQKFKEDVEKNQSNIDFYLDIIDSAANVGIYNVKNIGRRSTCISDDKLNCVFEDSIPDVIFICKDVDEANLEDVERTLTADQLNKVKQASDEVAAAKEFYLDNMRAECDSAGQEWVQVDSTLFDLMVLGGYQNSCFEKIKDLLYQYTNMNNTITINSLPIYYLEPNSRVTVEDPESGIFGDYMIDSISLPLGITGTMSVTAYKCLQRI